MEDSDILPYLHQDRIPPVDNSTRTQRLDRSLRTHRSYRIGKRLSAPLNKRVHTQWKAHPRRVSAVVALVVLALAGSGVYALTSHTFPSSPPITPGSAVTASTCTTLVYPASMPTGAINSAQVVTVNCGLSGTTPIPAFSVTTLGTDSASFTLPTTGVTVTGLGIVPSTGTCGTGETALTTGTTVSLTAASYNYCVHYTVPSTATSIATFSLSWAT